MEKEIFQFYVVQNKAILKKSGSSRINVKPSKLCERTSSKIGEIPETESCSYHCSYPVIETLNKSVCDPFGEVVENLFSPFFECGNKLG